jgi:hypothetical protein
VSDVIHDWREFLNEDRFSQGPPVYRVYHASFRDFLQEEVGLTRYHDIIAVTALNKIPGMNVDGN